MNDASAKQPDPAAIAPELVAALQLPADGEALVEVGFALGRNHAFGLIAGRCSAAQAEGIRRLREEKLYKRCCEKWEDFCPKYLRMSKSEADRTIKILEEFGPAYFELSQLTRISPETYRAIAPAVYDNALHLDGHAIELNSENWRKLTAAVAEMRRSIPKKSPEWQSLTRELIDFDHETDLAARLEKLDQCCTAIVAEFEKIGCDEGLGSARMLFNFTLGKLREELARVALKNGLA
jgi:hypothetical protein